MLRSLLFYVLRVRDWKVGCTACVLLEVQILTRLPDLHFSVLLGPNGHPAQKSLEKVCEPKLVRKAQNVFKFCKMLEVKVELNVRDLCGLSDVRCCVFVSFERVREGWKEERKKERETVQGIEAIMREHKQEKEIKRNKWAACFAQPRSRPRIRQVPNKTGLTPFVPLIFLYTFSFLSLH